MHFAEPLDGEFSDRELPSFLPPSCFSKFDRPNNYVYVCVHYCLQHNSLLPMTFSYRPHYKAVKPSSNEESSTFSSQSRIAKSKKFNLAYSVNFDSDGKFYV